MEQKKVTGKMLWLFAVGQFGWSLLGGLITNWLVFFYQPSQENINAGQTVFITQGALFWGVTVIGLITAICRIFDAVTDPWVGSMSDRCKNRLGRRIPFLRGAAIPFGIVTALVFFSPVNGISKGNDFFLLIMLLSFYLCMTLYCTPYNALIPELGKTQKNRINVSTYISMTFILGTAVAYLLPNIATLLKPSLGYVNSIRVTVAGLALIAVIAMLVPAFALHEKDFADTTPSQTPGFKSLSKTFKNKEFQTFVKSDVLYFIALTMFQTGLPFYITVLMKLSTNMTSVFFVLMTALSLVFYAPVNILAKKFGKKKVVFTAFMCFSLTFAATVFAGKGFFSGTVCGIIISVMASIPMAALGILPQAVVADIAECDAIKTGENREGMFYAARTFAFKLGQSVAMLLFTGLALIDKTTGAGYRVSAAVAAVLCLLGGLAFLKYHEKDVIAVISKDDKKDVNVTEV